jgi:hypothetical protein
MIANDFDLNCILATFLLTDGCLIGNKISFATTDATLRDLFYSILKTKSNIEPKIYLDKRGQELI